MDEIQINRGDSFPMWVIIKRLTLNGCVVYFLVKDSIHNEASIISKQSGDGVTHHLEPTRAEWDLTKEDTMLLEAFNRYVWVVRFRDPLGYLTTIDTGIISVLPKI